MILSNTSAVGILVDEADSDLDSERWHLGAYNCVQSSTYDPRTQRTGKKKLHRIIAERMLGRTLLPTEEVDHINGNPLDNRRTNLRVATHQQNLSNHAKHRGSMNHFIGVGNYTGKWLASITHQMKSFHIGIFDTELEAAWMRDQWALALRGEFVRLNFEYLSVEAQR